MQRGKRRGASKTNESKSQKTNERRSNRNKGVVDSYNESGDSDVDKDESKYEEDNNRDKSDADEAKTERNGRKRKSQESAGSVVASKKSHEVENELSDGKSKKVAKGRTEEEEEEDGDDDDDDECDTGKSKKGKGKREKNKTNPKKTESDEESEAGSEEYEVEKLVDIYFKKNGDREFLVRWKGFSSKDDTWEPENHLNCKDLIDAFMKKCEEARNCIVKEMRPVRKKTDRLILNEDVAGRKTSSRLRGRPRQSYCEVD